MADDDRAARNRRQAVYWRTLSSALGEDERRPDLERLSQDIAKDVGLPPLLLDRRSTVDDLLRRHPELAPEIEQLIPEGETPIDDVSVRRALVYSKLLLNVYGAGAGSSTISAKQYNEWIRDVGHFERAMGYAPGSLRGARGASASSGMQHGVGQDTDATGVAPEVTNEDVEHALQELRAGRGLMSEPEIKASLAGMERSLVDRMALREVLKDRKLAEKLTPSMALVEQLLRDKRNLEGPALANAKVIIRRYVDQLADVLAREVASAPKGKVDNTIPPKRVFRNLDLKRTIWKNLTNWNPDEQRLYVDRLYYRRTATKKNNTRLIIVVDQSGSMLDAMVNCTILASIFAGLPKIEAHLIAFDTQVIDLTAWVHDPFEVLLRTNLGGGNDGPKAMLAALPKIGDPRNTVMVWISDFYEFSNDRPLFAMIKAVIESGVHFVPVGSVSSSGYFNVNPWFRQQFKQIGVPLISGSLKTLITELRTALP